LSVGNEHVNEVDDYEILFRRLIEDNTGQQRKWPKVTEKVLKKVMFFHLKRYLVYGAWRGDFNIGNYRGQGGRVRYRMMFTVSLELVVNAANWKKKRKKERKKEI